MQVSFWYLWLGVRGEAGGRLSYYHWYKYQYQMCNCIKSTCGGRCGGDGGGGCGGGSSSSSSSMISKSRSRSSINIRFDAAGVGPKGQGLSQFKNVEA